MQLIRQGSRRLSWKAPRGFNGPKPLTAIDVATWGSWMTPGIESRPKVNLVFNGGGAAGVALVGALKPLLKSLAVCGVSGTSAGAITGALVAAGYGADTITERTRAFKLLELLDLRDESDDAVKQAYWSCARLESPDWVTQIITNNKRLRDMMFVKDQSRQMWAGKSWPQYLRDYAYWAVGAGDSLKLSAASWALGDTAVDLLMQQLQTLTQGLPSAIASKLQDKDQALRILLSIYYLGGACKGDEAITVIEKWLQEAIYGEYQPARTVTFRDLPIPLTIVATDLTNHRLVNFPFDLAGAPYNYPDPLDFPVAWAIRCSMSIPLVYEPMRLYYWGGAPDTGDFALFVDGGVGSNFPLHPFVGDQYKTIGLWLGSDPYGCVPGNPCTVVGYAQGMLGAISRCHDQTMMKIMGEDLLPCPIDMTIPLSPHERLRWTEKAERLTAQIAAAAERGDVIAQLELKRQLRQIETELKDGRQCGTMDFGVTMDQKETLIRNGEIAGEKVLARLQTE